MNQQEAENILSTLTDDIDQDGTLRHGQWITPVTIGLTGSMVFYLKN